MSDRPVKFVSLLVLATSIGVGCSDEPAEPPPAEVPQPGPAAESPTDQNSPDSGPTNEPESSDSILDDESD